MALPMTSSDLKVVSGTVRLYCPYIKNAAYSINYNGRTLSYYFEFFDCRILVFDRKDY